MTATESAPGSAAGFTPNIDPRLYRSAIGAFATGVTVVTASVRGDIYGMTMNSITSVSLDPCLLLICPKRNSLTGNAIIESGRFAVNVLSDEQTEISRRFMSPAADRFAGIPYTDHRLGVPLLSGCAAHLVCELVSTQSAGDHEILLGQVVDCSGSDTAPLVFHRGAYRQLC